MTYVLETSVQGFFSSIADKSADAPLDYFKKQRYSEGSLLYCPVLEAMNESKVEMQFQKLVSALAQNPYDVTFSIEEIKPKIKKIPDEIVSNYPIKSHSFVLNNKIDEESESSFKPTPGWCGTPPPQTNKMEIISDSPPAPDIISMTFIEKIKGGMFPPPADREIAITCNHWTTAVKINILMCNLFNLSFKDNFHRGPNLVLHPKDAEQFIDMTHFLVNPHQFNAEVCKEFQRFFVNALLDSEDEKVMKKGKQVYKSLKNNQLI